MLAREHIPEFDEQLFKDAFRPSNLAANFQRCSSRKKFYSSSNLQRARQLYIAKSLAIPSLNISNKRLTLLRKLAWLLMLFQVLDGFFTFLGISFFGLEAEGNPLVRSIMAAIGPGAGIALVKCLAISIIICICMFGYRVGWLGKALKATAVIYFLAAIVPWSIVFGSYFSASLGLIL